jgi:NTP pyrophosphatase (non-canonical NTP hydrolase)
MSMTFEALRQANLMRLPQFKNSRGEYAHSEMDGSDWSPSDWFEAMAGEVGEFANWHKKFRRGDISFEEFQQHAAKELADVQIYLDILALRCLDLPGRPHPTGIDLGQATRLKFNEVSERVGANVFIDTQGLVYQEI